MAGPFLKLKISMEELNDIENEMREYLQNRVENARREKNDAHIGMLIMFILMLITGGTVIALAWKLLTITPN